VLERDCQALEFHVHHDPLIMRVPMLPKKMLLDILLANKRLLAELTLPLLGFVPRLVTRQLDGISIFTLDRIGLDHLGATWKIGWWSSNKSESLIIRDITIDTPVVFVRDWFVPHDVFCIPWDQCESA
jgi:hypothetical protein